MAHGPSCITNVPVVHSILPQVRPSLHLPTMMVKYQIAASMRVLSKFPRGPLRILLVTIVDQGTTRCCGCHRYRPSSGRRPGVPGVITRAHAKKRAGTQKCTKSFPDDPQILFWGNDCTGMLMFHLVPAP